MAEHLAKKTDTPNADQQPSEQRIVFEAARRIVQRSGARALSLQEVAAEAGVAPEAVTERFHTADELLLALAVAELMAVARAMRAEEGTPGAWAQKSGDALCLVQAIAAALTPQPGTPAATELGDKLRAFGERQSSAAADLAAALEVASNHLGALDAREREDQERAPPGRDTGNLLARARQAANNAATASPKAQSARDEAPASGRRKRKRTVWMACLVPVPLAAVGLFFLQTASVPRPLSTPTMATAAAPKPDKPAASGSIAQLAESGNADAALLLGLQYLDGTGAPKDPSQALHWLQRAAESGQPMAQYRLGNLYAPEDSVVFNPAEAARWYEAAARQGNIQAMNNLAVSYAAGTGVAKDATLAAQWFAKAAELGYVTAQFNLAVLYERGEGVEHNRVEAYKWYALAAASGDGEAQSRLEAIAGELSSAERAAGQRAVQGFKPTAPSTQANNLPLPPNPTGG